MLIPWCCHLAEDLSSKEIEFFLFLFFTFFLAKADNLVSRELAKNNKKGKNVAHFITFCKA
jgi:hypothetical protein